MVNRGNKIVAVIVVSLKVNLYVLPSYGSFIVLFISARLIIMGYWSIFISVFMGGVDVGVDGCCNQGMAVLWVMVLTFCFTFLRLLLNNLSILPYCYFGSFVIIDSQFV